MRVRHLIVVATAVFGLLAAFAGGALAQTETIASVSPSSGPVAGGTTVVITGDYIFDAMPRPVTIGGVAATFVSQEIVNQGPTAKITVTTPAGTAGPADVVIYAYAGGPELVRKTGGFTYVPPAPPFAVTGVSPTSGLTTGGEDIKLTGAGFSGGSTPSVTIGGTPATNVTVVNDTTITATTPEHAKGAVDVLVNLNGRTVTASGAYTFDQGYWLTVKSTRPADIGGLESPGAIRTPSFGNWGTTDAKVAGLPGIFSQRTTTTYTDYAGGINCGGRAVKREASYPFGVNTVELWAAGKCRYAFPAGRQVDLTALPSSTDISLLRGLSLDFQGGFLGAWRNDCADATTSTCVVQMTADRTAGAAWGYIRLVLGGLVGNVVYPTYNVRGELQYYGTSAFFPRPPTVVGGTPTYLFGVTIPAKAAGATAHADATRPREAVCRTAAHVVGKRLTARCAVTPPLERALRRGSARATGTWYVRLPHSSALQPIGHNRLMLRGRRVSAITG